MIGRMSAVAFSYLFSAPEKPRTLSLPEHIDSSPETLKHLLTTEGASHESIRLHLQDLINKQGGGIVFETINYIRMNTCHEKNPVH